MHRLALKYSPVWGLKPKNGWLAFIPGMNAGAMIYAFHLSNPKDIGVKRYAW
jgi:hypothetical protein